jgi:hypothetical protein
LVWFRGGLLMKFQGRRHPSTADQKAIEKRLLRERKQTLKFMKSLPDMDAYSYLYSNLSYLIKHIDECLDRLKDGFGLATESLKQNKDQYPNRGRQWCHHNEKRT